MGSIRNFLTDDNGFFPVTGVLASAGAAKLGYGQWAAGVLAVFITIKLCTAAVNALRARPVRARRQVR
jgi:hypothetical protein